MIDTFVPFWNYNVVWLHISKFYITLFGKRSLMRVQYRHFVHFCDSQPVAGIAHKLVHVFHFILIQDGISNTKRELLRCILRRSLLLCLIYAIFVHVCPFLFGGLMQMIGLAFLEFSRLYCWIFCLCEEVVFMLGWTLKTSYSVECCQMYSRTSVQSVSSKGCLLTGSNLLLMSCS